MAGDAVVQVGETGVSPIVLNIGMAGVAGINRQAVRMAGLTAAACFSVV